MNQAEIINQLADVRRLIAQGLPQQADRVLEGMIGNLSDSEDEISHDDQTKNV